MVEVHSGDHLLGDISSDTSLGEKCPRGGDCGDSSREHLPCATGGADVFRCS